MTLNIGGFTASQWWREMQVKYEQMLMVVCILINAEHTWFAVKH